MIGDYFKLLYRNNANKFKFKEFEIFLWKKDAFDIIAI